MGALSYADDITLMAPSLCALNNMLKIYVLILLTCMTLILIVKKTVCMKFVETVIYHHTLKLQITDLTH